MSMQLHLGDYSLVQWNRIQIRKALLNIHRSADYAQTNASLILRHHPKPPQPRQANLELLA